MVIRLKKGKNKPSVLSCRRKDGSSCWTRLHPGIEDHELAHYAVETVLDFQEAFYGLIDKGYKPVDFELLRDQRPKELIPSNLPMEARQTEFIVSLVQMEFWNTGTTADFLKTLRNILEHNRLPFPPALDPATLEKIRNCYQELIRQWNDLPPGEALDLNFSSASGS